MSLTQIESPPRTLRSRRTRLAITSLLLLCLLGLLATSGSPGTAELDIFPKHFLLQPGEQIHYTVLERSEGSQPRFADAKFATEDPKIVRLIDPKGLFEAVRPGRTQLVVRSPTSERRITVEVAGPAQSPMTAVPYNTIRKIVAAPTQAMVSTKDSNICSTLNNRKFKFEVFFFQLQPGLPLFVEEIQYPDARLGQRPGAQFQQKIGCAFANDS